MALHSLHSLHEYSYPVMPDPATPKQSQPVTVAPARRDSLSSLKKNPMTSVNSCSSMATTAPMLPSKAGRGNNGKKKRRGSNSSSSSTKAMSISHLHPPGSSGKGSTGRVRCKHCQVQQLFLENAKNSFINRFELYRTLIGRKTTIEVLVITLPIAWDQPSMPSRASAAPSASCTIVTLMPKAILPPNRASVVPVVPGVTTAVAVVASNPHQKDGSDWRFSHWSYRVCGATCLCAPATDVEFVADAVVNLMNQQPNRVTPSSFFYRFFFLSNFVDI